MAVINIIQCMFLFITALGDKKILEGNYESQIALQLPLLLLLLLNTSV